MINAACKGATVSPEYDPFFPKTNDLLAIALSDYCSRCTVRVECDDWANILNLQHGVWGGKKR